MSTTSAARLQRQKPSRTIRLEDAPQGRLPGCLLMTVGKEVSRYLITLVPSQIGGQGYRLEKIGEPTSDYHVHLSDIGHHDCECLGYLRHGHCRHIHGLLALRNAGKLS